MPDVIQCPTCSKKFKLPEKPPAIFTCTGCGTAMDLSGFRSAPAPAAAPAASEAEASAGPKRERAGKSARASSARSATRGASRAAAGSRARRGRGAEEEGDDDGRREGPKKGNPAVVWGSIGGIVVLVVVVVFMLGRKPPEKPSTPDEIAKVGVDGTTPGMAATDPAMGATPGMGGPAGMGDPSMAGGDTPPVEPEPAKPHVSTGSVTYRQLDFLPDTTEDEKKQIDQLIQTAVFQNSGADGLRAEKDLVKIGMKAAPRMISVFYTVHAGGGFDDRNAAMKCGIADRVLRGIDGWYDRKNKGRLRLINARSEAKAIDSTARSWFSWWESDNWKTPVKPWDEATEGNRGEKAAPEEDGGMGVAAPMDGDGK